MESPWFISKASPGMITGMTVEQLQAKLSDMPSDAIVVMEGDRLISPHIISDVLPPDTLNTVLLSVGPVFKPEFPTAHPDYFANGDDISAPEATLCVCGGIFKWHARSPYGCDDCHCTKFIAVKTAASGA